MSSKCLTEPVREVKDKVERRGAVVARWHWHWTGLDDWTGVLLGDMRVRGEERCMHGNCIH
jgi:hypothetical protein